MIHMDELKKRRACIKGQFTRLEEYVKKVVDATVVADAEVIRARLEKLESQYVEFQRIQSEIEQQVKDEEIAGEEVERAAFEERYFELKAACRKFMLALENSPVSPHLVDNADNLEHSIRVLTEHQTNLGALLQRMALSSTTIGGESANLSATPAPSYGDHSLPKIEVPSFSGNILEWIPFRDLYCAIVHDNPAIRTARKFQYLKLALKGDAASVVKHLPITEANYEAAWTELENRYHREKFIIEAHIKALMDHPSLNQPNLAGLRRLLNVVTESVNALEALKVPVNHWDYWLIFVVVNKLDGESRQLWARASAPKDKPTFDELTEFIKQRLYELEALNVPSKRGSTQQEGRKFAHSITVNACLLCNQDHTLENCLKFKDMSTTLRRDFALKHSVCFKCLKLGHGARFCKVSSCTICQRSHHSLLHADTAIAPKSGSYTKPTNLDESTSKRSTADNANKASDLKAHFAAQSYGSALLPTALIAVADSSGMPIMCRALLDSGSQVTLISETCVQRLGLRRRRAKISIVGVGGDGVKQSKGAVELRIMSRYRTNENIETSALILRQVTSKLPLNKISSSYSVENLALADPGFKIPGAIDILIGCDIFFECLREGQVVDTSKSLVAQNTIFGWIISGKLQSDAGSAASFTATTNSDHLLRKFWELEEVAVPTYLSEEERAIEEHFVQTHKRSPDGRYTVRLPFKNSPAATSNSKIVAVRRLQSLERRLEKNPELEKDYNDFLEEYWRLGHMRKAIVCSDNESCKGFFLSHQAVFRPESSTTKLRVVFDASAKTSNGLSLNDTLMVGPVIQPDLFTLLLKFRLHRIALMADIAKMYRQILVDEQDVKYQTILWRPKPKEAIQEYELLTLTYGTSCAPFLATRSLAQLAQDDGDKYPAAARLLRENFYMDDLICGTDSIEDARELMKELIALLKGGGFDLRKWKTNTRELKDKVEGGSKLNIAFDDEPKESTKVLGLRWNPEDDCFNFKVSLDAEPSITKRQILSEISRIFDPLGWLAPCTVKSKMMLQTIWLTKLEWDEPLPQHLISHWLEFRKQLILLEELVIPRCIFWNGKDIQLIGFADASEKAFAAVVYLRTTNLSGKVVTNVLTAKTKVAPLKQITLPRLELCAAHLLAKLLRKLKDVFSVDIHNCLAYTDSTVVLAWLSEAPRTWKTFVANRTADILTLLPDLKWRHVRSVQNPADCASRGLDPSMLIGFKLWWHGPPFIRMEVDSEMYASEELAKMPDRRKLVINTVQIKESLDLTKKYSSLTRLQRITAYLLRFIQNARGKSRSMRRSGCLTSHELEKALNIWLIKAQMGSFITEVKACQQNVEVPFKSKISSVCPFLDENNLLRVGGRLQSSSMAYCKKHPIILNSQDRIAELIVESCHLRFLHAGPKLLQTIVQQKYYIVGCRILVKRIIRSCHICVRYRGSAKNQLMGNLPACRILPSRPFLHTGVDYAGPILVRPYKGRGRKTLKAYIALFVCMATKAIHLELAFDLSSEAFIAAFKRFSARRGVCANLYSDNGTNFVGAKRILTELNNLLHSRTHHEKMGEFLAEKGIEWHFSPPSAPNFGGIWEAGVKQVKFHLKRTTGNAVLTVEEIQTLLCQIEACLNSRPLCASSLEEPDIEALSPAHFLVGAPLTSVPEWDWSDAKLSRLTRWQLVQSLHRSFWQRWSREYLSSLQQRTKWQKKVENFKVDDVVLLKDERTPPCTWPLGRVSEIHPGSDGVVRVVTVRWKNGILKRPAAKLIALPTSEKDC